MHVLIADCESSERAALVDQCHLGGGLRGLVLVDSGKEALAQIRMNRPDVIFLACELKDMTGFDVLRAMDDDERPATIMLAPDDRYAAQALSSAATDYLTRPISADRLALAMKRAYSGAQGGFSGAVVQHTQLDGGNRLGGGNRFPTAHSREHLARLVGERAGRIYFFSPTEVDYIEADSNYVKIHVGTARYINRDSLTRLSALLEHVGFVRISRSILVNLQRVSFAEREGPGVLAFVLESGARVVSSTGFRLESGAQLRIARTRKTRRQSRIA
jgi:two-component system, LytTR family, response regulator